MTLNPLGRELTLALALKLVALIAIYALFFSPSHRPKVTPAQISLVFSNAASVANH